MRVVLDTNVVLSALIAPEGIPAKIYSAWRAKRFGVVTSVRQIDELRRISGYSKFRGRSSRHELGRAINNLMPAIVLDRLQIDEADDPEDSFLIAMAVHGEADCLVTGDRRAGLLERGHIGRTRILTPSDFCAEVIAPYH